MPLYEYRHLCDHSEDCSEEFELFHGINEVVDKCPKCGAAVTKLVSRSTSRVNIMSPSNLKEKGFKRMVRRDKGVYEEG